MWHIRRAGVCPYSRNIMAWTLEETLEVSQATSHRWRKKERKWNRWWDSNSAPKSNEWDFFSPTPSSSQTPSGCCTIQLSPGTIDQERASDSTAEGLSLTKLTKVLPPFSCSHKAGLSPVFWSASYIFKVPVAPFLGSIEVLEQLTELRKMFTYRSLVYYKRI